MPRVLFTKDFPFKPIPRRTIKYRKGMEELVTTACANAAIAAGAATKTAEDAAKAPEAKKHK